MKVAKDFDTKRDMQEVEKHQSVKSQKEMIQENRGLSKEEIVKKRIKQGAYSCLDSYIEALWNDNAIYISVTNSQHQAIVDYSNGKSKQLGSFGLGFFTDEATVNAAMEGDTLNNKLYNEMCQIAPYHEVDDEQKIDEYNYKPHVDKLMIDRDRLEELYGKREFPILVARCLANDVNAPGGGNQGYSHMIDQLIESRVLIHVPDESYSRYDRDLFVNKESATRNKNKLVNNTISRRQYNNFLEKANRRGRDCVEHNTPHPSQAVKDATGTPGKPVQLDSEPGHHTKMCFVAKLKEMVAYIFKAPAFTKADEKMLAFMLYREMNGHCSRGGEGPELMDTYSRRFLNNESVIEPLTELEAMRSDGSFEAKAFIDETAKGYAVEQDCEKGLKQYREDLKCSDIKYNQTLLEGYEKIYDKTGKAYTLRELAQMSKATVPELLDRDVKAVCEECRNQQVRQRNEAVQER